MKSHPPVRAYAHRSRCSGAGSGRALRRPFVAAALTGLLLVIAAPVAALAQGEASSNATEHAAGVVSGVADSVPGQAGTVAGPVLDVVADKLGGSPAPAPTTAPGTTPPPGTTKPGTTQPGTTPQPGTQPRPGNDPAPQPNGPPGANSGPRQSQPPATSPGPAHNRPSGSGGGPARNGSGGKQTADNGGNAGRTPNAAPSPGAVSRNRSGHIGIRPLPQITPSHAMGRANPPSTGVPDGSHAVAAAPPAMRVPTEAARRGLAGIADALRFPIVLLALLLGFLALQQRADRSDPKLARAPIGGAQDWLEFR
jgi:hypothetical protein